MAYYTRESLLRVLEMNEGFYARMGTTASDEYSKGCHFAGVHILAASTHRQAMEWIQEQKERADVHESYRAAMNGAFRMLERCEEWGDA